MRRILLVTLVFAAVLIPLTQARCEEAHLGVSGGYGKFTGEDFKRVQGGLTVNGSALFPAKERVLVGLAFDYSTYGIEDAAEKLHQWDLYGVVRYTIPANAATPYVGGMAGYSKQSAKQTLADGSKVEPTISGLVVGPTVGVLIPVGTFSIDLSACALRHSFGNIRVGEQQASNTESSAIRYIGRVGVSYKLGE